MTAAIVGSSGYIGSALRLRLEKEPNVDRVLGIDQTGESDFFLDLSHAEMFDYGCLEQVDSVIFTAAISGPDKCASDYDFCWGINVTGTSRFIQEALRRNCRVLFFSSDAVFGDIPGEIYTELSETRASTAYGRMKKEIEDQFKNDPGFKAIRLSYVVSSKDRFVSYCLNCIREGRTAEVFHPFYRNCISLNDVLNVVCWMLSNWDRYEPWVLNVAGAELVSRLRIADEINRLLDNKLLYAVRCPDDGFYQNRPRITQMKSLYMRSYQILSERNFTETIKLELEDINHEL